jgi:protein involved in polysaccharide export with SLBB domain
VLNPLSSINNVLFSAGGPTDVGSYRNISLKRNNKVITNIDLYDLFIKGNSSLNQNIQSGDVLLVNPSGIQVKIFGEVKRPAIFELKKK